MLQKIKQNNKKYIVLLLSIILVLIIILLALFFYRKKIVNNNTNHVKEEYAFLVKGDSKEIKNDDIFEEQAMYYEKIQKEYKKNNYTLQSPYVVVDPFNISPQTALVMFKTKKKEGITLTIKGKHNDDFTLKFEASKDHFIPVYGLYGEYANTVIVETESGEKNTITIKIDKKCDTGETTVIKNDLANSNGEFYFATSSLGQGNLAIDNYGEVRWWLSIGYTKGMTMLQNGNILLSTNSPGPDTTSTSGVVEVDMLGYVHKEYEIDGGYHHDGYELKNGNLIILTSKPNTDVLADYIVLIDRQTGKMIKDWNLSEIVRKIDPNYIEIGQITWGWINSVFFDEKSNSLILSLRNQNSVVSLDFETGNINWILGEEKYWNSKFLPYLIKGDTSDFLYPHGQHSVSITDEGYLSIFNNDYDAYHEMPVACSTLKNKESYAILYKLDLINKTASIVWKFGGREYFSYALSSFTYTTNHHKVFNSGWHFTDKVNYDDPSCNQFSNDLYDAYIIEFDENNNIVVNLHVNESKFEVVKAPIYNLSKVSVNPKEVSVYENYTAEKGKFLSMSEPEKFEKLSKSEVLSYANAEDCYISFTMTNKRLKLVGYVPLEQEMSIILISLNGDGYRLKIKEKNSEIKQYINLSSIKDGKYYVYFNMGDEVYSTTEFVVLK